MLGLFAGGGADDFIVDDQIDAGFTVVRAAADEKGEVIASDGEGFGGECAAGAVAVEECVYSTATEKAIDLLLVRQSAVSRAGAEGVAGGGPAGVIITFEIGQDDVIGGKSAG
jgi:hypothetical protein